MSRIKREPKEPMTLQLSMSVDQIGVADAESVKGPPQNEVVGGSVKRIRDASSFSVNIRKKARMAAIEDLQRKGY